jgi:hypothetical protein
VSSDSHGAVSVWRIQERAQGSLQPKALCSALRPAVYDADSCSRDNELSGFPSFTIPGSSEASDGTPDIVADEASEQTERRRVANIASAFWKLIEVKTACVFSEHDFSCLALTFVPAMPSTLVWLEAACRIHIADVLLPRMAHRIVHLSTLPIQIALAADRAKHCAQDAGQNDQRHVCTTNVDENGPSLGRMLAEEECSASGQEDTSMLGMAASAAVASNACPGAGVGVADVAVNGSACAAAAAPAPADSAGPIAVSEGLAQGNGAVIQGLGRPYPHQRRYPLFGSNKSPSSPEHGKGMVSLWFAVSHVMAQWRRGMKLPTYGAMVDAIYAAKDGRDTSAEAKGQTSAAVSPSGNATASSLFSFVRRVLKPILMSRRLAVQPRSQHEEAGVAVCILLKF